MIENYKTDLFEINVFKVSDKQKEFPNVVEEVKYNNEVLHTYTHNTHSSEHANYLLTERLEACKPPKVLAFILIRYGYKHENTHLVKAGKEYLETAM